MSGAIGEGDVHLPAFEIRQLAEIEVGAEIDLLGILRPLPQTAARIARRLREVMGAQMEALGLQLRSKPAPIAGHVGLLQPIIQGLGLGRAAQEQARDGDRDRGDQACDGSRSAAVPAPCHEGGYPRERRSASICSRLRPLVSGTSGAGEDEAGDGQDRVEQEGAGPAEDVYQLQEGDGHQQIEAPIGDGGDPHGPAAEIKREDLGDQQPEHRPQADGEEADISGKAEGRDPAERARGAADGKAQAEQDEAGRHAERGRSSSRVRRPTLSISRIATRVMTTLTTPTPAVANMAAEAEERPAA